MKMPGEESDFKCKVRPRHHVDLLDTVMIRAKDEDEAVSKLQSQGFLVILIRAKSQDGHPGKASSAGARKDEVIAPLGALKPKKKTAIGFFKNVSTRELISFAIQLSALLHSGVPLIRALQIVQKGTKNSYFAEVLDQCIQELNQGLTLSHALKKFPKVFPPVWINLVEIGEASGNLPDVLKEVAHYQEAAQRVKSKVISAFFYPSVLSVVAIGAITFLLIYIVPKFQDIFSSHKAALPALTRGVILLSSILRNYAPIVVLVFIGIIVGLVMIIQTPRGKLAFDRFRLKLPIMGVLLLQVSMIRFSRGLATLLRSGVPILHALEISGKLTQNVAAEKVILEAMQGVKGGHSLGEQLERSTAFPVFMTQLVSIGEESGDLDRFLDIISNYYEESVDTFLSRLSTLLEPVLLVFMGAVIGLLVIAMFLPIIEISTGGVM